MEKQFTTKELKALVEEFIEYLVMNFFKGNTPVDWVAATLDWIENHPAKAWDWSLVSIIDLYLNGIKTWDCLTIKQREVIAKEIVKYLKYLKDQKEDK